MNTITNLRNEVQRANTERLDRTVHNISEDLEYLASCDQVELENCSTRKVGLELYLKEPRLLEHLDLADYLIGNAREEQQLCLTDKGQQLYEQLKEEGFYQK